MRTRLILGVGVLFLLSVARPARAGEIWLGANGTFTSASMSESDLRSSTAFAGGIVAGFGLGKRFSLVAQPGLLIRRNEGTVPPTPAVRVCFVIGNLLVCSTTPARPGFDFTNSISYVEVPLLAKLALREKGVTPYLVAGPSVGFVTSAKYKPDEGTEEDIKEDVEGVAFGIGGGLGLDVPLGQSARLFVEGQYVLGLTGAYKSDSDETGKFRTVVVKAGVQFAARRSKSRAGAQP